MVIVAFWALLSLHQPFQRSIMSRITAAERPSDEEEKDQVKLRENTADLERLSTPVVYRLYKRRWFGIVTLVGTSGIA